MKNRFKPLTLLIVFGCVASCFGEDSQRITLDPPPGRDDPRAGSLSLDETRISTTLEDDHVQVSFEILNTAASAMTSDLQVRILDLGVEDINVLGSVQIRRLIRAGKNRITIPIDGALVGGAGRYVIEIICRPDDGNDLAVRRSLFESTNRLQLQVTSPPILPAEGSTSIRASVRNSRDGSPLADAAVKVLGRFDGDTFIELGDGTTDDQGNVTLSVQLQNPTASRADLQIVAEHDIGQARIDQTNVEIQRSLRIHLSTDKPRYQPGQQIHLRALALRLTDRHPIDDESLAFEVYDGEGNRVHRSSHQTNRFGVASLTFQLAQRVNEGMYRLVARLGEVEAHREVVVEHYRLPVFSIDTEVAKSWFAPEQTLEGLLTTRYPFGEAVVGAEVQIQAETKQGEGYQTFQIHSGTTDAQGTSPFRFVIPAAFSTQALTTGDAAVRLTFTVVDTAGQREIIQRSWRVAAGAALVHLVPENGAVIAGTTNRIHVLARDPGGDPLALPITLSGPGLSGQRINTDQHGTSHFELPTEAIGHRLTLQVTPPDAPAFEQSISLPVANSDRFLLRPTQHVLRAPGVLEAIAIVPGESGSVFLDVIKAGSTLASVEAQLENGQARFTVPLDERFHGGVTLSAISRRVDETLITGRAMVYIEALANLDISMEFDQAQYRPGEQANLQIEVEDGQGNPVQASVGLTAVDEAVFALGDAAPGRLETHFDLASSAGDNQGPIQPSDVLTAADDDRREALAQLAFPTALGALALVQTDSEATALQEIRQVLALRIRMEELRLSQSIQERLDSGLITWDDVEAIALEYVEQLSDPFGQPYRHSGNAWRLRLTTAGPDEIFDTPDDFTGWIQPLGMELGVDEAGEPEAPQAGGGGGPNAEPNEEGSGSRGVQVRSWFPETLFTAPSVIVDEAGRATVDIPLADSITTWRVGAQANSVNGALGSNSKGLVVFQPFFVDIDLPVQLTVGDQVDLPVVVYNYLESPQEVDLELNVEGPMEVLSSRLRSLQLEPNQVLGLRYRVRATSVGTVQLTVTGQAEGEADAVRRSLRITPDGDPIEQTIGGRAEGATNAMTARFPVGAVPDANELMIKLYPGYATNAVEGMESMLRVPSGCFEQTTSTAWPNILALQYLEATGEVDPELRSRALELLATGYQRILTFESPTGGYNWWGNSDPGNRILTAIALMQFAALDSLIEIDERVADRHRAWLVGQQANDGSWASGDALHSGNEALGTSPYRSTAFITWGLATDGGAPPAAQRGRDFLVSHLDDAANDRYALALITNALLALDPNDPALPGLLGQLAAAAQPAGDGQKKWDFDGGSWTGARGGGTPGEVEMTGLVVYALIQAGSSNELVSEGLAFLAATKDAFGNWYSTQATVNSLRALLTAAIQATRSLDAEVVVSHNGHVVQRYDFRNEDFGDVHLTTDLSEHVVTGENQINVAILGEGSLMYQVVGKHYRPWDRRPAANPNRTLSLDVSYERTELTAGETTRVRATATNHAAGPMDQVIVSIGRPPGFDLLPEDLDALVADRRAARWEADPRKITFYLMGLPPETPHALSFRLRARYPMQGNAPTSSIDSYYEPGSGEVTEPIALGVSD